MRAIVSRAVAISGLLWLAGCGGSNNASDPVDACKNVFSTLCNKLFQCNPTEAAQAYGNTSSCASTLSASCSAATMR